MASMVSAFGDRESEGRGLAAALLCSVCIVSSGWLRLVGRHVDPVLVLARLGQIEGCLLAEPEPCVRPAGFFQANGHFRRNGCMAVQDPREGVAGNSQHFGCFGHVQAERSQAVLPDAASGMRGSAHERVEAIAGQVKV